MSRKIGILLFAALFAAATLAAPAGAGSTGEEVVTIPTRDGVTVQFILLGPRTGDPPAVILFTGGDGVINLPEWDGKGDPRKNFLVRSRKLFANNGLLVAVPDAPSDLIESLCQSRWLDRCRKYRLVIHDWAVHAPNWLHATLAKKGEEFVVPELISPDLFSVPGQGPVSTRDETVGKGRDITTMGTKNNVRARSSDIDFVSYTDRWNEFAPEYGLASVNRMSDKRKSKIAARHRTDGFDFDQILDIIPKCPLLLGDTGRGWKVSFDWIFINDDNWTKIIEGNYIPGDGAAANLDPKSGQPYVKQAKFFDFEWDQKLFEWMQDHIVGTVPWNRQQAKAEFIAAGERFNGKPLDGIELELALAKFGWPDEAGSSTRRVPRGGHE